MLYLSSSCIPNSSAYEASKIIASKNIFNIELSSGNSSPRLLSDLKSINTKINFIIHNYFPPPVKPFVFNLASLNKEISNQSLEHANQALLWASELGSPFYSFHAGFLIDPPPDQLGKPFSLKTLSKEELAKEEFLKNIEHLSREASKRGICLLIENNVLSKSNFEIFQKNPFLLTSTEDISHLFQSLPSNVKFLVDLAHLKVSAQTLHFDKIDFLNEAAPWIKGYHLSDNDGTSDTNNAVDEFSWFWPYIKKNLDYYSLEIYNASIDMLEEQYSMVKQRLIS